MAIEQAVIKPNWLLEAFKEVKHESAMMNLRYRLNRKDQKKLLRFAKTLPSFNPKASFENPVRN